MSTCPYSGKQHRIYDASVKALPHAHDDVIQVECGDCYAIGTVAYDASAIEWRGGIKPDAAPAFCVASGAARDECIRAGYCRRDPACGN